MCKLHYTENYLKNKKFKTYVAKEILTEIIENDVNNSIRDINIGSVDKYVIELIRISQMYKFEIKVKSELGKKPNLKEKRVINPQGNIEEQMNKKETKEDSNEIKQYLSLRKDNFENIKIIYKDDSVKIKNYPIYKEGKQKKRFQELWEKEGFYQINTTQTKVRVQLWPEHLPYDHLKRKRAFLFC